LESQPSAHVRSRQDLGHAGVDLALLIFRPSIAGLSVAVDQECVSQDISFRASIRVSPCRRIARLRTDTVPVFAAECPSAVGPFVTTAEPADEPATT
jgi:hypothetical protein